MSKSGKKTTHPILKSYAFLTIPILFVSSLLSISCQSVMPNTTVAPVTPPPAVSPSIETPASAPSLMYENEGFVSRDTYVVIIVHPFTSSAPNADIESQAKKRALTSLLKYKHSQGNGKMLSQNGTSQLVIIINENGKLMKIDDQENSRSIYQFVINRENLKQIVDGL